MKEYKNLYIIIIGVSVFAGVFLFSHFALAQNAAPVFSSAYPGGFEKAIETVAATTGQSVVSISSEITNKVSGPGGGRRYYFGNPDQNSPSYDDFFDRFFEDFFGGIPEKEFKQQGLGSGVIIDKEGYILTNEHVVANADKITVTLPNGSEFKAEVKGVDTRSDLAVIKISGRGFSAAALGDSDALKIGQWVVAIGNPFGFAIQNSEPTVTVGVVSALHRSLGKMLTRNRNYTDLIQTDAAINPGNSGGPLVNLKGEIVGINAAIVSTTGGYQGLGFAIPINDAKKIVAKLIEGKKIVYGWLGVSAQDLDDKLIAYFGLSDKNGVVVSKVIADSPAKKGGIKEGDIIVSISGQDVRSAQDLLKIVGNAEAGSKVKVEVIRDKKQQIFNIDVGVRPEDIDAEVKMPETSASSYWRGIQVSDLSPDLARKFRLNEAEGVVITDIKPDSPGDEAGLLAGDVILEINRVYISNLKIYKEVTRKISGDCLVRTTRGYTVIKSESR